MHSTHNNDNPQFRLIFKSKMTFEHSSEIEDMILDALRRYTHIEVDLSNVREIDICGVHLLGLLENFANKGVSIIATSPAIEKAHERLHNRQIPPILQTHSETSLSRA
jgi:hypothetical protein